MRQSLERALGAVRVYFRYGVVHRLDKAAFLRSLGTKVGRGSQIITSIPNFGREPWLIEIGDDCTITSGVVFLTHDASSRLFRADEPDMNPHFGNRFGRIVVRDRSFVGVNSILLPDITIGPRSIVGAGSLVNRDVPPETVVAGNPARVICTLDEYIAKYRRKMISLDATTRDQLREELGRKLGPPRSSPAPHGES